eukprot:scaffold45027_cov62-Phaeocystis_antarctica.AAC.7
MARLRGARRAALWRAVRGAAGREVGRRCRCGAARARRGWRWVSRPWRTPRASSTAAAALGHQRLTARAPQPRSRPVRGATPPAWPPHRAPQRRQPRAHPRPRASPDQSAQATAGSGVAARGGAGCPAAAPHEAAVRVAVGLRNARQRQHARLGLACQVETQLGRVVLVEEEQGAARCTAAGRVSQQLQRGERQELAAVELQQRELRIAPGRAQQRLRERAARGEVRREPQRRAARVERHVGAKIITKTK